MPDGLDYALFDYEVNSGPARAAKVLQRLVGADVDGIVGEATLALVQARDPQALITALCDERLAFLQRLKTWPVFAKGGAGGSQVYGRRHWRWPLIARRARVSSRIRRAKSPSAKVRRQSTRQRNAERPAPLS